MRSRLAIVGLLAALSLLAGCFDYTIRLTVSPEGAGTLATELKLPAAAEADHGGRRLRSIVFPYPERSSAVEDGRLVIRESAEFPWLDDVVARRIRFKVVETGTGIVRLGAYRYEITAWLESLEGDLPDRDVRPGLEREVPQVDAGPQDPAAARARRLLARTMGQYHVSLVLDLPGRVTQAQAVVLGATRVDPVISGGKVVWRMPVSALISENLRHNLVFHAEFKGHLAFRVPEQTESLTRGPTKEDEERLAEERARRQEERAKKLKEALEQGEAKP